MNWGVWLMGLVGVVDELGCVVDELVGMVDGAGGCG